MLTCGPKDPDGELFETHFLVRRDVLERMAQVPRGLCRQCVTFVITTSRAAEALRIGLAPDVPRCVNHGMLETKNKKKKKTVWKNGRKTHSKPKLVTNTTMQTLLTRRVP